MIQFVCKTCGARWDFLESHYSEQCILQQLRNERAETNRLRAEVASWKEAWLRQREVIGTVWWWREKKTEAWKALQKVHKATVRSLYEAARERDLLRSERGE